MPSDDRVCQRLEDIIENIQRIDRYVEDMDYSTFLNNDKTLDAVERCFQRITEAAIHIGEDAFNNLMPRHSWRSIRNLGNILRHEYSRVNPEILWDTIEMELPGLSEDCGKALAICRNK